MGQVLRFPATAAHQALATFREEERSFHLLLEVLKEWRHEELFRGMLDMYRRRMRHLRRVASALLADLEPSPSWEDLRQFARGRDRYR